MNTKTRMVQALSVAAFRVAYATARFLSWFLTDEEKATVPK